MFAFSVQNPEDRLDVSVTRRSTKLKQRKLKIFDGVEMLGMPATDIPLDEMFTSDGDGDSPRKSSTGTPATTPEQQTVAVTMKTSKESISRVETLKKDYSVSIY